MSLIEDSKKSILISDGAMATVLVDLGFPLTSCLTQLNLTQPKLIQQIHQDYLQAGSQILYTNTFGASHLNLKKFGLEDQLEPILQKGVQIARSVAIDQTYVAGNLGPIGLSSQEIEDLNLDEIKQQYIKSLKILVAEGIDLLALETLTNFKELQAATLASLDVKPPNLPVSISVSPQEDGSLLDGTDLNTWISFLNQSPIDYIGINCFSGPRGLNAFFLDLAALSRHPINLKPNAGIPHKQDKKWIYPVDSNDYCLLMNDLVKNPVAIIGGCCGTTPEYINKLAKMK